MRVQRQISSRRWRSILEVVVRQAPLVLDAKRGWGWGQRCTLVSWPRIADRALALTGFSNINRSRCRDISASWRHSGICLCSADRCSASHLTLCRRAMYYRCGTRTLSYRVSCTWKRTSLCRIACMLSYQCYGPRPSTLVPSQSIGMVCANPLILSSLVCTPRRAGHHPPVGCYQKPWTRQTRRCGRGPAVEVGAYQALPRCLWRAVTPNPLRLVAAKGTWASC